MVVANIIVNFLLIMFFIHSLFLFNKYVLIHEILYGSIFCQSLQALFAEYIIKFVVVVVVVVVLFGFFWQ